MPRLQNPKRGLFRRSQRVLHFELDTAAVFTVGLAVAAVAAVKFWHALPYEEAIAEIIQRSKTNCLPGERVSSRAIPTPVDSWKDRRFMAAATRHSIGMSFPVAVGENDQPIPPNDRVGYYHKTCELEKIPKVLENPAIVERVLVVANFNNQASQNYTPLGWYNLTTKTNFSEPTRLDPTRYRNGPATPRDIQTALSALNISSTIITDSNGKEFVEVLPFAQTEALDFYLSLVAKNEVNITFYEHGNLQDMAQQYMDQIKQNQ